jgi:hypothetical protein
LWPTGLLFLSSRIWGRCFSATRAYAPIIISSTRLILNAYDMVCLWCPWLAGLRWSFGCISAYISCDTTTKVGAFLWHWLVSYTTEHLLLVVFWLLSEVSKISIWLHV